MVPFKRSFLLVGGYTSSNTNQILQFDPDNFAWIKRPETLPTALGYAYVTMISDEAAGC